MEDYTDLPDDDEEYVEIDTDSMVLDAVDFFGQCITREYPEVTLEIEQVHPWRLAQKMTVPEATEWTVDDLDQYAFHIQKDIYFNIGVLVAYYIERETVISGED